MKKNLSKILSEKNIKNYRPLPFWSWNDHLEKNELIRQINWMKTQGFGGYFMHARGGLTTEYLSDEWFDCIKACINEGEKLEMNSWAYDENGWPSGFVGGKLLEDTNNADKYLTYSIDSFDCNALVSYDLDGQKLTKVINGEKNKKYLNVYENKSISTVDILNPRVVKEFLNKTHEQYKKYLGKDFKKKLCGFFTDEPQYYRAKHAFSDMLPKYFSEVYHQDIYENLGLMFVEKEGYRDFRYKYWKAMQTLMLKNFSKQVYDWCDDNGIKLTGHYVEEADLEFQNVCCGGIMPFYEYEHIPGVDMLGDSVHPSRIPKQVSSVAAQLGKKQILTESFAGCGWGIAPRRLRTLLDAHFVNGVNLLCQHLLPYSEQGQRKRDYPAHFSWVNPWVKNDIKSFNDYFAKLGYLIGESTEKVNVGVFCPNRSVYFDFKREKFREQKIVPDLSYQEVTDHLSKLNIPYHVLDETILSKYGNVKKNKLNVGKCTYEFIIFPTTYTMDATTQTLLQEYYNNGGKILFMGDLPNYLEGVEFIYNYKSNCSIDDILKSQQYTIDNHNTEIISTLREIDGIKFIYASNLSSNKDYTVKFKGDFNSFEIFDLETLEKKPVNTTIHFKVGDSFILLLSKNNAPQEKINKEFYLDNNFTIIDSDLNYLTLDKLSYSFDGLNYSEKLKYAGVFDELLKKRFNGEVYLKYEFEVKEIPSTLFFLSENMNNVSCSINGKPMIFDNCSDFDKKVYKADISKNVIVGNNQAIIKIHFFEKEHVYNVLYGENIDESLVNCLVYDTTIESCYLQGNFSVASKTGFTQDETNAKLLYANDFYITKPQKRVSDLIKDGYPFFAGKITLENKFNVDDTNLTLVLSGNYCLCDLIINGKKVTKSYFANRVDISQYISKGENTALITLYSGNRNLLGPFHTPHDFVCPNTFMLEKTWVNGKSPLEYDHYSFEKFGLYR